MVKLGPKKPSNATAWDEVDKSQLVQILISHEQDKINSLQFAYAGKLDVHHSQTYGEPNCSKFNTVTFDYPSEFLVSLSGRYVNDKLVSIVFGTNKRKYGPFGSVLETPTPPKNSFSYPTYQGCSYNFNYEFEPKSSFGGFHGSVYNGCVCTIGVYVNPVKSIIDLTV